MNLPQEIQVVDLTHRCSRHATEQSNTSSVSMTQRTACNLYTTVYKSKQGLVCAHGFDLSTSSVFPDPCIDIYRPRRPYPDSNQYRCRKLRLEQRNWQYVDE